MGSQYSTETKAEVIEMARQGKTSVQIGQETSLPVSTVGDWVKAARDLAIAENRDPLLVDGEYRLAFLGQQINQRQLEELLEMQERGESTLKYMVAANIVRGTAIDKVAKQPPSLSAQTININFISQEAPIIEGEVVE